MTWAPEIVATAPFGSTVFALALIGAFLFRRVFSQLVCKVTHKQDDDALPGQFALTNLFEKVVTHAAGGNECREKNRCVGRVQFLVGGQFGEWFGHYAVAPDGECCLYPH